MIINQIAAGGGDGALTQKMTSGAMIGRAASSYTYIEETLTTIKSFTYPSTAKGFVILGSCGGYFVISEFDKQITVGEYRFIAVKNGTNVDFKGYRPSGRIGTSPVILYAYY